MKVIAQNKKAKHDYFLLDKYEAGIELKGTEIKNKTNKILLFKFLIISILLSKLNL